MAGGRGSLLGGEFRGSISVGLRLGGSLGGASTGCVSAGTATRLGVGTPFGSNGTDNKIVAGLSVSIEVDSFL